MKIDRFKGDGLPPDGNEERRFPYKADPDLTRAVNIAIHLDRPLLVKGPPGCGKTTVARAIAHELDLPLFPWYIKSTTRAIDGLYTIDVVRRLQDAQRPGSSAKRITPYLKMGELGKAFRYVGESVVLIDEIDKADIDFPNDLLRELDEKRFTIDEIDEDALTDEEKEQGWQREYGGDARPIVVITSNDEKELPDAFLRRCVFHWIDFPDVDPLIEIVQLNTRGLDIPRTLIHNAVIRLDDFRAVEGVRKKPATSELIDWVRVMHAWGVEPEELDERIKLTELPHWKVLFKHQQDGPLVKRAAAGQ